MEVKPIQTATVSLCVYVTNVGAHGGHKRISDGWPGAAVTVVVNCSTLLLGTEHVSTGRTARAFKL